MLTELARRALVVLLVVLVTMRVVVGELSNISETRPRSQARPKGYELRTIRPLGRRLVAIRVQVLIA